MKNISHIKHGMRVSDRHEARPEETKKAYLVRKEFPKDSIITQYDIPFVAKIDVANTTKKIAWFLNGPWHESKRQTIKDRLQYEKLVKMGWKIYVLWYNDDFISEKEPTF